MPPLRTPVLISFLVLKQQLHRRDEGRHERRRKGAPGCDPGCWLRSKREVDERIELDDTQVLAVLDKMVKQRRDSIAAVRTPAATNWPPPKPPRSTSRNSCPKAFDDEIAGDHRRRDQPTAPSPMRDMGKVMAIVKPKVQGRADVGKVSGLVKQKLG